jgi:exodeoxyribonuclease V beta subunit
MLFGRQPGWPSVPPTQDLHEEADVVRILGVWQGLGGPAPEQARWADLPAVALPHDERALVVRTFTRGVDTTWRRTSYTALSSVPTESEASPAGVTSEPEDRPKDDEPDLSALTETPAEEPAAPSADAVPSPMGTLPVGATFGSLVHAVLEHADPDASELREELLAHIEEQLVRWPVALDAGELADALVAVCDSPLGPVAGGATLRGIPLRDRLCEMEFELPLSGGDDRAYPVDPVTLGDVAPLLRAHLPQGDPLLAYADTLASPALGGQDLRGYLTGSVDVVLRIPTDAGSRYLVVDYKTNWLGGFPGEDGPPLTSDDYRPEVLDEAMGHSDYPLQALLYAVVLHRFLRWRQPGYDPEVHLGGVLYLYLRGMCGPQTPEVDGRPCGVFSWRPPVALVEALSDLLDGSARREGAA